MSADKTNELLSFIAELLILIITNQFGVSGNIREARPVIDSLKNRLREIGVEPN